MSTSSAITPDQFTTFGDLLKYLRRRAGLTQQELSIGVGYSVSQVSRLEKNQRVPDAAAIAARFVPELDLEKEKAWVARLLELAEASHAVVEPTAEEKASAAVLQNLPLQLSSFIGREMELEEIADRLNNPACRLLTLIGAGGIGKTRLAVEAASKQVDVFPDGVFFVPLAPLGAGQADLIASAIANSVGFTISGARPPQLQLVEYLRPTHMLLLLDNFEHVLEGRQLVLEILRNSPHVKILATSRAPLNVQPEWLLHVSGLSYPLTAEPSQAEFLESGAARLFVERARQVNISFALSAETMQPIMKICQSVEGMPLALELAAAQSRTFPFGEIAKQVSMRLDSLQTKMHDVQPRHRSLRAVLDWSYTLLSDSEQELFRSLSVFAGSWTLEAAAAVGASENVAAAEIASLLSDLIDKSLVVLESSQNTVLYRMLEPVRQYAAATLQEHGELDDVGRRHMEFYVSWSSDLADWHNKPRTYNRNELDNLRAATARSQHSETPVQTKLHLAMAMSIYCQMFEYQSEARTWVEGALAELDAENRSAERADATRMLADILANLNEYSLAESQYEICMTLYQELGEFHQSARALGRLGWLARERGDGATALTRLETSLALHRDFRDQEGETTTLITMGEVYVLLEKPKEAKDLIDAGIALAIATDDQLMVAWGYNHLARVAQLSGEFENARRLHESTLPLFPQLMPLGVLQAYEGLGETALGEGDAVTASSHLKRALGMSQRMGDRMGVSWCLAGLAGVAVLDEEPERAARLWGAAEHLRQSIGVRTAPAARATHDRLKAQAREQLGETAFAAAEEEGSRLTMEEAIALAMQSENG